jgi:prepilin-type N-terminal cleavage/methylation domain-containing protein
MNKINKQKGFTLIELMVVVGVISLVSSIITYSTSEAKVKAEDSKMIQEAQQVEKAIQLYKNDHNGKVPGALIFAGGGSYPYTDNSGQSQTADLDPQDIGEMHREDSDQYQAAMSELVPEYYPEIPESTSGESYAYMVSSSGEEAVFSAVLKKPISSGSGGSGSRNSCGIVVPSPKSFTSCSLVTSGSASCSGVNYNAQNQACFAVTDYSYLTSNCACANLSRNSSIFPSQLCMGTFFTIYTSCVYTPSGFPSTYVCNFTGGTPVCGGGSNNDFCACI